MPDDASPDAVAERAREWWAEREYLCCNTASEPECEPRPCRHDLAAFAHAERARVLREIADMLHGPHHEMNRDKHVADWLRAAAEREEKSNATT